MGKPSFLVLSTIVASMSLSACGSGQTVLNASGEEQVLRAAAVKINPALAGHIKSLSCPKNLPPRRGQLYKCKLTATDGESVYIEGIQLDNLGHLGAIQFSKK